MSSSSKKACAVVVDCRDERCCVGGLTTSTRAYFLTGPYSTSIVAKRSRAPET